LGIFFFVFKFQFIGLIKENPRRGFSSFDTVEIHLSCACLTNIFAGLCPNPHKPFEKGLSENFTAILRIATTNLIFRKNRSQCCLSKRRRTSVLRACAGGAEGDFNKNQLDKLEFDRRNKFWYNGNIF
jgi:hypothetical protein